MRLRPPRLRPLCAPPSWRLAPPPAGRRTQRAACRRRGQRCRRSHLAARPGRSFAGRSFRCDATERRDWSASAPCATGSGTRGIVRAWRCCVPPACCSTSWLQRRATSFATAGTRRGCVHSTRLASCTSTRSKQALATTDTSEWTATSLAFSTTSRRKSCAMCRWVATAGVATCQLGCWWAATPRRSARVGSAPAGPTSPSSRRSGAWSTSRTRSCRSTATNASARTPANGGPTCRGGMGATPASVRAFAAAGRSSRGRRTASPAGRRSWPCAARRSRRRTRRWTSSTRRTPYLRGCTSSCAHSSTRSRARAARTQCRSTTT